jgi:tRNA(fMet)-specific endonuclease VapC
MKYLLDTNICIYIIKRKPSKIFKKFESLRISDVAISSITLAELEYGVYKSTQPEKNTIALTRFLAPISILPFEDTAAKVYGIIHTNLELKGQPIGPYDLLIAAHAHSLGLTLVTNNIKEFKKIKDLKLENWM